MKDVEVINLLPDHMRKIIERSAKAAFCLGTTTGQLGCLLNMLQSQHMTQDEVYKEVRDIWKQLGKQVHEIYYKDNERESKE